MVSDPFDMLLQYLLTLCRTSKIYYMFGFLFVAFGLCGLTTAMATILLTYFMLSAEDYRWQWRAFLGASCTGLFVFLNAIGLWASRFSFGGITGAVLYVGYSALISFLVSLLCGTIGFMSAYAFNMRIYSQLKVD